MRHSPLDAADYPVPAHLRRVFVARDRMVELAGQVQRLAADIGAWEGQPYALGLDVDKARDLLLSVRAMVLAAAPYSQCGCPAGSWCKLCESKRWLSQDEYLTRVIPALSSRLLADLPEQCKPLPSRVLRSA